MQKISISVRVAREYIDTGCTVHAALKNGQDVQVHQFLDGDRLRTSEGAFYPISVVLYYYLAR